MASCFLKSLSSICETLGFRPFVMFIDSSDILPLGVNNRV